MKTLEEIHDAEIAPLMEKILQVCKEHKIPTLVSFDLSQEANPDLCCTSALNVDKSEVLTQAFMVVYSGGVGLSRKEYNILHMKAHGYDRCLESEDFYKGAKEANGTPSRI